MLRRLRIPVALTAGLLALACGGEPAGGTLAAPRSAPHPVTAAWLYGVSATSGTNAWAVGAFNHAGGYATLVEHWNGRAWKPMPTMTNIPQNGDSLTGIAATSATSAWAAGTLSSQYSFPLIYQLHDAKWGIDDTPTPGGSGGAAYLNGVAAASSTDAWAVGAYLPNMATLTMILRWNGKKWVQVPSPNPAGHSTQAVSVLQGVAVLSPTDAWAVGEANTGGRDAPWTTVIENWNGTSWTTVPSPDPSRASCVNDDLLSVAAAPAGTWAVGDYCGASLVLQLEDGQWQQVPSPTPRAGVSEQLASVSVTSAANAWAVGHIANRILILHWNGAKWVRMPAPDPVGATKAQLTGVSAVSSSIAWAVGEADYPHGVSKLLIERWDGTSWKLVPVPNPAP